MDFTDLDFYGLYGLYELYELAILRTFMDFMDSDFYGLFTLMGIIIIINHYYPHYSKRSVYSNGDNKKLLLLSPIEYMVRLL